MMTNAWSICKTLRNGSRFETMSFSRSNKRPPLALRNIFRRTCCQWGTLTQWVRRSADHAVGFGLAQVIYSIVVRLRVLGCGASSKLRCVRRPPGKQDRARTLDEVGVRNATGLG
jgi:hypothetical protein